MDLASSLRRLSATGRRIALASRDLLSGSLHTAMSSSRPLAPPLGRQVQGAPWTGAWNRMADAAWLGSYTPTAIPHSVRRYMRRDAQISLGLKAIKSPFYGIEYRVKDEGRKDVRAFLRRTILESPIFTPLLSSILNSFDFGCQTHEIVWGLSDVEVDEDGPGGEPARVMPAAYVVEKLRDLAPERCAPLVDEFGDLDGIQVAGTTGSDSVLKAEKLLHVVHRKEFDNHRGESGLDPAYPHWFSANVQYLLLDRYLEQKGNPPLIGYAPNEKRYEDGSPRDSQAGVHCLDVLNKEMISLRNGGACALPFEVDDKGNLKWRIGVLEDSGRSEMFITAINHQEGMKLRGLGIPERTITQDTATGSFAMASVHASAYRDMLEVIKQETVLGGLNELGRLLVRANYGRSTVAPRFDASPLSREKIELLADLVGKTIALPRHHEDGTLYNGYEILDLPAALETLNAPRVRSSRVKSLPPKPAEPPPAVVTPSGA